jgi:hypothetical protein
LRGSRDAADTDARFYRPRPACDVHLPYPQFKKSEIVMNSIDDDLAWLQSQLTVARWHLDAAIAAPIEIARRNIERARRAYDGAREALRKAGLTGERHRALTRELDHIRERLQSAGVEV